MNLTTISIRTSVSMIVIYLIVCGIIPTVLDRMVWRTLRDDISSWINLLTLIVINTMFLLALIRRYKLKVNYFSNITLKGILLAFACSVLFYFLLDKFLDPFFDSIFTRSAAEYSKAIHQLQQYPVVSFIRVCLLAPVVEEILIRGIILNSLLNKYDIALSLFISTLLFAILHFNFLQTISAIICGIILGLLYISTGSLFNCILAHSLYNAISYFANISVQNFHST
ncbi:CPBP family intramembrane glutamic endopeptidase [Tepidimicrobium xylanilyticum]|uniref:CAAX prenyl protease 2/Lysostaphin resistance protein A-like domain-containing protein n=1 Tax=Tepidimicrobium xylanilyticum TaxID=1123352 RepID=A0A1H2XHF6_9FIRM|nr:type II CAAX endopeptidase family protein [Tepidimicrobium xylanilyticum]SDW92245.1 hypothetical protein SAMN05660923_01441 [Tepidimicrobium xylanilyticum]